MPQLKLYKCEERNKAKDFIKVADSLVGKVTISETQDSKTAQPVRLRRFTRRQSLLETAAAVLGCMYQYSGLSTVTLSTTWKGAKVETIFTGTS